MFMKHHSKALLALMVIAAMPLMAADDKTINVNTTADEDGTNLSNCSLREALQAAALNRAYGGCSAGNTRASAADTIQLQAGNYSLNAELVPTSNTRIFGASPVTYTAKDPITNTFPQRTALVTTIDANNTSRIFNTSVSKSPVVLSNVILNRANANGGRGGAIYAGGSVELNRVNITNSNAANGGAIYLERNAANLTISNSLVQNSNATAGSSVLAMSCIDNLVFVPRQITITYSSFINNGNNTSSNMIEFCGQPTAELSANTIAKNTANSSNGSIVKFTTDSFSTNDLGKLATNSTLLLLSNTIVENNASSAFLYDSVGLKSLSFNVLAFNNGNDNKSCRYLPNNIATASKTNLALSYNAINLTGSNSVCDVASDVLVNNNQVTNHQTIDVMNNPQSTYLSALQSPSAFTAFLPLYYPLLNDQPAANTNPIVNTGGGACSSLDQRSFTRITNGTLIVDTGSRNTCDVGSVEISRLTAADIENLTNKNMVELVDGYDVQIKLNQELLDSPNTDPTFLPFYTAKVQEFTELFNETKLNTHYRPVYIDPFALSLPHETRQADGSRQITLLNKDNYTVSATAKGLGATYETAVPLPNNTLRCEWNDKLQFIVMYKTTDAQAQAGEDYYCDYTLTLKSDSAIRSTGIVKANFTNIAPIAKNDEYSLRYGSDQSINVNLLVNDSDDGDGPTAELTTPNKAKFYKNANGVELPIRIDSIPAGLVITPERSGPCPGIDSNKVCFGGNLNILVKNSFNPFDYSFNYVIYDAEGLVSRDTATVKLLNTANNVDSSKGGGGSLSLWGLMALFGLALSRQKIRYRKC